MLSHTGQGFIQQVVLALYSVEVLHQVDVLDTTVHQTGRQTGIPYSGRNAVLEKTVAAAGTHYVASNFFGGQGGLVSTCNGSQGLEV